jgi:putative DNA primase/helicase
LDNRGIAEKYEGKWRGILLELGLPQKFLKNRQGPCPMCGGKDRFRFDDKGLGMHYCNQCGAGDGPKLAMRWLGLPMGEVVRKIRTLAGEIAEEPFDHGVDIEKRRRILNAVWKQADRPDIAAQYLKSRGLRESLLDDLKTIRGTHQLWDSNDATRHAGVVSLVQDKTGRPVSLHRIFLGYGKRWKKLMPPLGTVSGAAIRLGHPHDVLHVCEGLESGLAIRQMTNHPVWCGISANGMSAMDIPDGLTRLDIWADMDDSFTGQMAAYTLANRYWRGNRHAQVSVVMPMAHGKDPLDVLREGGENLMIDRTLGGEDGKQDRVEG